MSDDEYQLGAIADQSLPTPAEIAAARVRQSVMRTQPTGVATKAIEFPGVVGGYALNEAAHLPERAFGSVFQFEDPAQGTYNPAPIMEAATSTMGMGGLAAMTPGMQGTLGMAGGRPVRANATGFAPSAPAIISRAEPTAMDIEAIKAAAREYGRKGWPTAEKGIFETTPEAYAETTKLVPQISIRDRLPAPVEGKELPRGGRVEPVIHNAEEIANRVAERLYPMVKRGDETLKFYHTGPVIRGLERTGGLDLGQANVFMRDWAGQGAATSPRTQTPPNLRNSSFLSYERARGEPMTPERYAREGNEPGFPMMGMHVDLADKFARGTADPWTNPKPFTFRENWSGNLRDVTADTHNIRSTLYELDRVNPGELPKEWFTKEGYQRYRKDGFEALKPGDISDTLEGQAVKKIYRQSEYSPMAAPWYRAAEKLGIAPAEAQSGGWFSYGPITGLQSPPKTIVNLLNDQIEATSKALGVAKEKVLQWWAQGKIPLASLGGGGAMGDLAAQDNYQRA